MPDTTEVIEETKELVQIKKKKIVKLKELKKKPNQLQSVLKSIEQVKKDFSDKKKKR